MCHLGGATTESASASDPQSSVQQQLFRGSKSATDSATVSEPQSSVNGKEGSRSTDESNGLEGVGHAAGGGGGLQPPAEPSAQPEQMPPVL